MGVIDMAFADKKRDAIRFCTQFIEEMPEAFSKSGVEPLRRKAESARNITNKYRVSEGLFRSYVPIYVLLLANAKEWHYFDSQVLFGSNLIAGVNKFYLRDHETTPEKLGEYIASCRNYEIEIIKECLYAALNGKPWSEDEAYERVIAHSASSSITVTGDGNTVSGRDTYEF